jgi:hypothetical protein
LPIGIVAGKDAPSAVPGGLALGEGVIPDARDPAAGVIFLRLRHFGLRGPRFGRSKTH